MRAMLEVLLHEQSDARALRHNAQFLENAVTTNLSMGMAGMLII
jgi:hypothetical protein